MRKIFTARDSSEFSHVSSRSGSFSHPGQNTEFRFDQEGIRGCEAMVLDDILTATFWIAVYKQAAKRVADTSGLNRRFDFLIGN